MKAISCLLLLLVLVACSGKEAKITGTWKLEKIDYSEHFSGAPEEIKEMLRSKMAEEFERIKGKTFFVFSADKSLELKAPNYVGKMVSQFGKWEINAAQDSVFFDVEMPENYKIVELTKHQLVLKTDEMPKRILHLSKED